MTRLADPITSGRNAPLLAFLLSLAAVYFARDVLIPLALAALLSFLLTPAVRRLEYWRLPRVPAVLAVLALSICFVGVPGWVAANQLLDVLNQLPNYKENIHTKLQALREPGHGVIARASAGVEEISRELSMAPQDPATSSPAGTRPRQKTGLPAAGSLKDAPVFVRVVEPPSTIVQSAKNILGPLLDPLATGGIVLVFTVVMLLKREDLRSRLLRLVGKSQLYLATEAIDDASTRISRYLRLQFIVNSVFGLLISVGLHFIGLPNALLWGVLAGVLRFVPFVGAIIGATLPFVLSLALFNSWVAPSLCLGLFAVVEPIVAYVIEPALYGTHTGISSLAILVSAAFWTTLWGPVGLILSTPLTVCLVVIGRHVPQLRFLHILLGDEAVLSPSTRLYQRLLALDDREARALIDTYVAEHSRIELYDEVLIPALSMAEEERHKGSLDVTRERFLHHSLEEFISELADLDDPTTASSDSGVGDEDVLAEYEADGKFERSKIRVFCIPATDRADEITCAMLAAVLESAGHPAVAFPLADNPDEMLKTLAPEVGDVVCISALPPFALINARTLIKKLRTALPRLQIVLGLWNFSGGGSRADERLSKAFTVAVVRTLAEALEQILPSQDRDPLVEKTA